LAIISPAHAIYSQQFHNQTLLIAPEQTPTQTSVTGSQPTLIVLVQFPDTSNSTSPTNIQKTLTGLNNYYAEDSYGLVSFTTTIYPASSQWYTLPHTMAYYGTNTPSIDSQLITDSLQAAYNAGVNFHRYKYAIVVHTGNDEAITRASTDIHSFTILGFAFSPTPLSSFQISTSVVSESDPVGVYCHEAGHLLGLPDLYDLTQQIDPVNNFIGYWDIMALGEWNPNNGNPLQPSPGTYPSQHSAWSKIKLGWISNSSIQWVYPGNLTTVVVHDLEQSTTGIQAVEIPIAVNPDGSLTYYLVEMRAKLGQYDQYIPFPSDYPSAALLIYKVNESITAGYGNLVLENAHPGSDLRNAGFGPCYSPCTSNNTFSDPSQYVKIIVTSTNSTAYTIVVDRTSSPLLLLQVDTPAPGMSITIDGTNSTSDQSNELRLPVHMGPHEIYVQTQAPVSLGATSIQVGLSDSFAAWSDGKTANPRWVAVVKDTVLTATYRVVVESTLATAITATIILGVILTGIAINQKRKQGSTQGRTAHSLDRAWPQITSAKNVDLFPGNDRLGNNSVESDKKTEASQG
jgi:M6 family metalloprotease-like protein